MSDVSALPHPELFLATAEAAFQQAADHAGLVTLTYVIAGYHIRLCFAGTALVPHLTPALAHLAVSEPDAQPDLTLYVWDSVSTESPRLVAPWPVGEITPRGEVPAYSDGRFMTAVQLDMPGLHMLDRQRGVGLYWIDDSADVTVYERAAPLKVLLHWALCTWGYPMIHAAAVGMNGAGALIVGKTGVGKSTTALLCLSAGMQYISDDRCLVGLQPEPTAYCIYNSAKLFPDQMQRFPHLRSSVGQSPAVEREKTLVFVQQYAPEQVAEQLPIKTILLAHLTGNSETTLSPVSPIQVLRELFTSSMVYQPGMAQEELRLMATLVQQIPCQQINLGSDLARIPDVIARSLL